LLAGCADKNNDFYPGYAEADTIRISTPITGTLTKLHLQRGDHAQQNALAFVLEQESERAAREEAHSRMQRAQALLADLKKGKRPDEVAAVQAQLAQAEAALRLSSADLSRQQQLVTQKFISPARLDEARAAVERDRARVNELRAQLRIAQLGARSDEIQAAEQDLKAAQAQLDQAEWKVAQKTQRVPVAGDVMDVLYREGELVPAGSPVVSLLPPQNIKARFFVSEPALGALRLGQDVTMQCDGCGAPIAGKISFIAKTAEYTSPLIYSKENRTTLVFMLEARPSVADAPRLHPGQPLEIRLAKSGKSAQ
jgi:HlyD family secretion protein